MGSETGYKRLIEAVIWMALMPLGIISRKPMANGLKFTKDCSGGVVFGCGNV